MADKPWERNWGTPQQSGGVVRRPVDPYAPNKERRADEGVELERARLGISQQAEARQQATLAADVAKAEADARKAQIEADRAEAEAAKAPRPETNLIQQSIKTSALLDALNVARSQIAGGMATGNFFGGGAFAGVPIFGQNATNLSTTLDGLKGSILTDTLATMKAQSSTGASGMGSLTEKEGERLAASIGALHQEQDAESLLRNLAKVERHYRNMLALSYGEDPREPEVMERYGIRLEEESAAPRGGSVTSEGNTTRDPALAGVNASVKRMIRAGADEQRVRDYLNAVRPGMGDAAQNVREAIEYGRQNPDRDFGVDLEGVWTPTTGVASALGEIGMSPVGSSVIGAADFLTGGTLDNLTANPDAARASMSGVQQLNPTSYLLGQIGGGALGGLGLEAGLARGGLSALNSARVGDVALGAAYGAGSADEEDQSRVLNALLGGTVGAAGGAAGRGVANVVGSGISGVTDPTRRALDDAGIRMTPGQILGGGIQRTEDRLAGLPLVGDQIMTRRMEGLEDFNRAAFADAADALGVPTPSNIGGVGIDKLRQGRSQRYGDLLDNRQFSVDPQFETDIAAALAQTGQLPQDLAGKVTTSLEGRIGNAVRDDAAGMPIITGRDYQSSLRGLDRDVRSLMREAPVMGDVAEDAVRGGRDALLGLVERQAPGVYDELASINRGNSLMETLRSGVNAARNQGELVTPAQLSTAASQTARRFGNNQGTTNQPFYGLTRAAQEVLPSSIPDSGTAGRMVIPFLAGAAGGSGGAAVAEGDAVDRAGAGAGTAVIAALLASAPYSPAARNTLQTLLLAERPQVLQQIGGHILGNNTIASLLAAPAATVSVIGQK